MNEPNRASGSLPEDHDLYAPGLKRRPREGREACYWLPRPKDIAAGFAPKSITLPPGITETEIAARCRDLWGGLEAWREEKRKGRSSTNSVAWLIDKYLSDPESPFHAKQPDTRDNYEVICRAIRETIGQRRIDPVLEHGVWRARIKGADVREWHRRWGAPAPIYDGDKPALDADGRQMFGPPRPSRARHMIAMFRTLMSYGQEIDVHGAAALRAMLMDMEFPSTAPRTHTVERPEVLAFVEQAIKDGWPSIAMATLAQFELTERRVHIIGKWDGEKWGNGWEWARIDDGGQRLGINTADWTVTYYQTKRGRRLRVYDLKMIPKLLAYIQAIPEDKRSGAVIKCETTDRPWRKRYYTERFAEIRERAGLPSTWWSMDMRSGAATEADQIPEVTDRMMQDAAGWNDPKMAGRYRRQKHVNAGRVVEFRQNKFGNG